MEPGIWRFLEKSYGVEIIQLQWMRSALKIDTDKGTFVLKKFTDTKEELSFVTNMMEHLNQGGFRQMAPVFKPLMGHPYFRYQEHYYYLQHYLEGQECSFQEKRDVVALVETLARMHLLAQGSFTPAPESRTNLYCWPERLGRRLEQIIEIKNMVLEKKVKDGFDKLFLTWVDYFIQESRGTIYLLAHSPYLSVSAYWQKRGCFCHHDLVFHNVIVKGHEAFLIDFDNCLSDIQTHDLVNLLNYVLKENQWQSRFAFEIIERYDQINPLTYEEFTLLGILLNYPLSIWLEVYWHYCRGKFDDHTSLKRLRGNIELQVNRRKLLDQLLTD